ncbi:hypothetical protein ABZY20_14645 [Streptomyces sp. NPDC006624]|uniref:hypothetical protein n=1 Tax=Streptomyces sp. NPDC006624 TaxID=3154892 RepID=UPI0033AD57F2
MKRTGPEITVTADSDGRELQIDRKCQQNVIPWDGYGSRPVRAATATGALFFGIDVVGPGNGEYHSTIDVTVGTSSVTGSVDHSP